MSVWAQAWAYEQRVGKWRKSPKGNDAWKGDPGAKSVLAAAATFADENGYCFVGQETLSEMTDMTERSVREHLYNLEHGYRLIRRAHRRRGDGEYTSDGIWLLAPKRRLRPPRAGDPPDNDLPAEKFSVGEKRIHRATPPEKSAAGPAEKFSGEPSGVEPSEVVVKPPPTPPEPEKPEKEKKPKQKKSPSAPPPETPDYGMMVFRWLADDSLGEEVSEFIARIAAKSEKGLMAERRQYKEFIEPIIKAREEGKREVAIRYALEEANKHNAKGMGYFRAVLKNNPEGDPTKVQEQQRQQKATEIKGEKNGAVPGSSRGEENDDSGKGDPRGEFWYLYAQDD